MHETESYIKHEREFSTRESKHERELSMKERSKHEREGSA